MSNYTLLQDRHLRVASWNDYPKRRMTDDYATNPKGGPAAPLFGIVMAEKVSHVAVTGRGRIIGVAKGMIFAHTPVSGMAMSGINHHVQRRLCSITAEECLSRRCHMHRAARMDASLCGLHFEDSRRLYSAHDNANGDGIDIDGCCDVMMSDCIIDADDNALIFKGRANRDNRNITVQGCVLASKITAIKTGTESGGGFQNIVITNCIIRSSYEEHHVDPNRQQMNGSGIALETTDGGDLDGIIISNIVMEATAATPWF